MRFKYIIPLLCLTLTSCSTETPKSRVFCFNTWSTVQVFDKDELTYPDIEVILKHYDNLSDNYLPRGTLNNLYQINNSNESLKVDKDLYDLLKVAANPNINGAGAKGFDYRIGSLSKKWKDSLANKQVLSEQTISEELTKLQNTSLDFGDDYMITRTGEAEIDLGGIIKGYTLDIVKDYLNSKEKKSYIIDLGMSSILLGEKQAGSGYFNVTISDLDNSYIQVKNAFVSTSGTSKQGVTINGTTYSHIINPLTGSALNNYDAVIVISDKGYVGDVLSTSMMMSSIDEIKDTEQKEPNIKVLVIKNSSVIYKSEGIEVLHY